MNWSGWEKIEDSVIDSPTIKDGRVNNQSTVLNIICVSARDYATAYDRKVTLCHSTVLSQYQAKSSLGSWYQGASLMIYADLASTYIFLPQTEKNKVKSHYSIESCVSIKFDAQRLDFSLSWKTWFDNVNKKLFEIITRWWLISICEASRIIHDNILDKSWKK